MRNSSRATGRLRAAGIAVFVLALVSACAGGDAGDSGDAEFQESGAAHAEGSADRATSDEALSVESDFAVGSDPAVDLTLERDLIKTATIQLESAEIDQLLIDLDDVVAAHDGIVESEDVRTDDDGETESASVVLRVPVERFEIAVEDVADLGLLIRTQTSTEDVTTRVADIDARVASAERSVASLQRLFDRAQRLRDVIRLESELSRRQADLESLQAQQRIFARQTALSTVHLSVLRPEATPREDEDRTGFVAGLESGWSGLVAFVRGAAHVAGLVLPLGVLAFLVGVPVWLVVRRWRHGPAGT